MDFSFNPNYSLGDAATDVTDTVSDSASTGFFQSVGDYASSAWSFLQSEEGMDALKGAAAGGLAYLQMKEQNKAEKELVKMREDRADRRFFVGGSADTGGYGNNLVNGGILTHGRKRSV